MKKILLSLVLGVMLATACIVVAAGPQTQEHAEEWAGQCTTIQDGTLLRSDGVPIVLGFDEWRYNYQGHLFNGMYCDSYRDAEWCQPYADVHLDMILRVITRTSISISCKSATGKLVENKKAAHKVRFKSSFFIFSMSQ